MLKVEVVVIQNYSGIVEAIRTTMAVEGINQAELARRSGVAQGLLSRMLKGKRMPRSTTLARLLDTLGLRIDGFQG